MIPLRIEATNFGAIAHADIDLTNVTLAAVCGPNGAGKSTLFTIAPIFALFGTTKNGCSVDDMVRTGTQEMGVVFDFEHRREIYRSTRTRSKKGKGKSTLELQHLVGGQWVSESGTTIRETEERIRELLNLDAETFTASSMILQGKANEFTSKPPGQRKSILAQILGLEVYERLQEVAKAKERVANAELEKAKLKLSELEKRLEAKPDLELELIFVEEQLQSIAGDIAEREKELLDSQELVRQLQTKIEKAQDLYRQFDSLAGDIAGKQQEQWKLKEQLNRANKMLAAESQILEKSAEYEQIKEQVAILKVKKPRFAQLDAEQKHIEQDISRMETVLKRLGAQIHEAEAVLANRAELEKAAGEYKGTLSQLEVIDRLQETWNEFNNKALEFEKKVVDWNKTNKHSLSQLGISLKNKQEQSSTIRQVPCAGGPLVGTCPLLEIAFKAQMEIPSIEAEIKNLKESENPHSGQWATLISERDSLGYNIQEHHRLKSLAVELRPKAEQAAQLEARIKLLENLKQQQTQRREEVISLQRQLKSKKSETQTLAEELKPLPVMEMRLPKLAEWARAKEELPAARQLAATAKEAIAKLDQEIVGKEEQGQKIDDERRLLLGEAAYLGTIEPKTENLKGEIKSLQLKQNELHSRFGGLKAQLESLAKDEEESQRLDAEIKPLAKVLVRWRTLVKAFGRDGIPALIIENAVPELERIANEILGQMSKGENSLKFETQRELKSKDGRTETLDIIVGDWHGERPYETFSGGEQLRIDFAIRFALAELLARRAGSRVEWLTIDEGLGSQDAEHRGLVLDAIKAVADRFRKTLVITHIEEAQAAFEQQIYFEPGEQGAEVRVA